MLRHSGYSGYSGRRVLRVLRVLTGTAGAHLDLRILIGRPVKITVRIVSWNLKGAAHVLCVGIDRHGRTDGHKHTNTQTHNPSGVARVSYDRSRTAEVFRR